MPDKPRPRWYHLTPDRFLLGLLLVVGVLFLSEWFCWFPFNEKKGWTVLIAIATVCGAFLVLLLWFVVSLFFRRRFQFNIRSLLVLVLLCAVVCSWFAVRMKQAKRQEEAVVAIREAGAGVWYAHEIRRGRSLPAGVAPSTPAWLVDLLGVDFFEDVLFAWCWSPDFDDEDMVDLPGLANLEKLWLAGTQVTDCGLEHLTRLTNLKDLDLSTTQVTDTGLEHLRKLTNLENLSLRTTQVTDFGLRDVKGLTNLKRLDLSTTQVTDTGLEHLRKLTNLEALFLDGTQISDFGLGDLKGLSNLKALSLGRTQISDSGLGDLKGLNELKWLNLDGAQITDSGLEHLKGLTKLERLFLADAQITDSGLKHLKELTNLRVLTLWGKQLTDAGLEHLNGLTELKYLSLIRTQVTAEGVKRLRQALPDCAIDYRPLPSPSSPTPGEDTGSRTPSSRRGVGGCLLMGRTTGAGVSEENAPRW